MTTWLASWNERRRSWSEISADQSVANSVNGPPSDAGSDDWSPASMIDHVQGTRYRVEPGSASRISAHGSTATSSGGPPILGVVTAAVEPSSGAELDGFQ